MQVVEELSFLRLDILDEAWVEGIYYSEFLEFGEFPSEYEEVLETLDVQKTFKNIIKSVRNWLNEESDEDKSWTTLSQQVPHEKLLSILAYHIDHGTKNVLTKEYRNNALLASRVYYRILSIPGFKAYHIYHSQLFAHSLACLNFPKAVCENENNTYKHDLTKEVNSIIKELGMFVVDLKAIMETLQLNPSDMNFEDILSNLVDITGGAIVNKFNVDKIEFAIVSSIIYEIIDTLICDSSRTPDPVAIRLLFKCILPKLVAASVDSKSANSLVRASYVTYSGLLVSKYGKAALTGYTVLLEHLCFTLDGLERAEVRLIRVSLVVGLMSMLPQKSYRKFIKWLLTLSTTSKVSHRQIALEVLSQLLSNEPDEDRPQNTEQQNTNETQSVTSTVPIAGGDAAENQKPEGETANGGEATGEQQEGETEQPPVDDTPEDNAATMQTVLAALSEDESTQDSQTAEAQVEEVTEEEANSLLHARAHTVPYGAILVALYERAHDVASTLRARALALLTDCLASRRKPMQDAIKELNGSGSVSRLMALGARCVCDERAAVRRAAVALVQKLLAAQITSPTRNDLGILVGLCRDASILVRSAAIAALGELVVSRPTDPVVDAFLSGPVHQLSDPETKVQEQVVSLVQPLLIERLQKFAPGACEDELPWRLLAGIARHNMRRHLQKACTLLNKASTCISPRLVDILSTHLGALDDARDLQCLVLLTSLARHTNYGNVAFALKYYYKLADDTESRDQRLLPLTLELLTTWSSWALPIERTALRDHLVQRLAMAQQDGCRLATATLAAHLDPDNLTWATELMQLSERRASESTSVFEWVRAADLSLVAPALPDPALLRRLLNALANPPPEWGGSEVGACVAGVGRLCVRSRDAAAAAAPPLAATLADGAAHLHARVNALLTLTDICTRYTCIVEPLLGCVCGCLSIAADAALRRAAARALTRLLLAGYLRLRTPLYYRYCALLSDDDHDVREPAEYYVTSCLAPDVIYHHFVDCVMHYNAEGQDISISFDSRQLIYDVMLQRLSIVQKLNLQCRLAREVLEHAADMTDEGDGELSPAINAALLDTITLLCGPRMKLPKKPPRDGEAADIDDLHERITTNIVSHKMKRTVAEVVVPAVLRLYSRVGSRGGQVAAYLVRIATDLLNDYRHEIEELIENDEELVDKVRHFQETIGLEPSFRNSRNLVTASTSHEPETPRSTRKRPARAARSPPRKRALRI